MAADERRTGIMKKRTVVLIIACLLIACCIYTHRRVIRALIKKEPMPKAPNWHFWVKKENRRG